MYKYQEFPRVVYGPDGESTVIQREEERPEGWKNHPSDFMVSAEAEAASAAAEAKAAEKALRDGYKDFLDRHGVDYAKNLGTDKLGDLVKQIEDHLALNEADDGDGE